jgi:ferrous iron transport protein A
MQLSFKKGSTRASRAKAKSATIAPRKLAELREGQQGIIDRLDLPEDIATRLMELGFLPGSVVTAARSAPGGDPRVFRVDGSEIALRKETAANLILKT